MIKCYLKLMIIIACAITAYTIDEQLFNSNEQSNIKIQQTRQNVPQINEATIAQIIYPDFKKEQKTLTTAEKQSSKIPSVQLQITEHKTTDVLIQQHSQMIEIKQKIIAQPQIQQYQALQFIYPLKDYKFAKRKQFQGGSTKLPTKTLQEEASKTQTHKPPFLQQSVYPPIKIYEKTYYLPQIHQAYNIVNQKIYPNNNQLKFQGKLQADYYIKKLSPNLKLLNQQLNPPSDKNSIKQQQQLNTLAKVKQPSTINRKQSHQLTHEQSKQHKQQLISDPLELPKITSYGSQNLIKNQFIYLGGVMLGLFLMIAKSLKKNQSKQMIVQAQEDAQQFLDK